MHNSITAAQKDYVKLIAACMVFACPSSPNTPENRPIICACKAGEPKNLGLCHLKTFMNNLRLSQRPQQQRDQCRGGRCICDALLATSKASFSAGWNVEL